MPGKTWHWVLVCKYTCRCTRQLTRTVYHLFFPTSFIRMFWKLWFLLTLGPSTYDPSWWPMKSCEILGVYYVLSRNIQHILTVTGFSNYAGHLRGSFTNATCPLVNFWGWAGIWAGNAAYLTARPKENMLLPCQCGWAWRVVLELKYWKTHSSVLFSYFAAY